MLGRIVELAQDDRYVCIDRGFLVVKQRGTECGRVPLDDISAVVGNAHGLVYSNNALTALAERGAPIVICSSNHRPAAVVWPLDTHFEQAARIQAQAAASRPLKKRLWQAIVVRKLDEQASLLEALDRPFKVLRRLVDRVRSGDPDNLEAQGARHYWRLLFGTEFRRDVEADGTNSMLNYGYAVLRASCARAIVAAGLHPSIGVFHRSGENAFQLVDDLMEAFRPIIDGAVYGLSLCGIETVDSAVKKRLGMLMYRDFRASGGNTPLIRCIELAARELATAFATRSARPGFPASITSVRGYQELVLEMQSDEPAFGIQADVDDRDV
jgi:CRISPR-associated protein Cas1